MRAEPDGDQKRAGPNAWDVDSILNTKAQLNRSRNVQEAAGLLQDLVTIDVQNVTSEEWQALQELIRVILSLLDPIEVLGRNQLLLLQVINDFPDQVVYLIVQWLAPRLSPPVISFLGNQALAVTIALARRVESSGCAETIADILSHFGRNEAVIREIDAQLASAKDTEQRFRLHTVTARMLIRDPECAKNLSPIELLIAELRNSGDILSRLNALELLSDVAASNKTNAQFLCDCGLAKDMHDLIVTVSTEPDGGFLFPACIRFFAHLAIADPSVIERFPRFMESVFDLIYHFDQLDAAQRALGFDTLALVASTHPAKRFLHQLSNGNHMMKAMQCFGAAVSSGPVELRTRHLEALSRLFENSVAVQSPEWQWEQPVLEQWFSSLGEPFPSVLLNYLRKPFAELRLTALALLKTLLDHPWAQRLFYSTSGFMEYLLDRKTEPEVAGGQLKYDLVLKLVSSVDSSVINQADMQKLRLYQRQGAFFVEKTPQVDFCNE